MRKILLTSAGFETDRILNVFHDLLTKAPSNTKALFIPTAANDSDAIAVLPKCMNDLLKAGILPQNIGVFDLHRNMEADELNQYDVVYFTGGSPQYLLERINDTGFNKTLAQYVNHGGIFIGVSAGSLIATNSLPNNLGYINCTLSVHAETGTKSGEIDISQNPHVYLTGENVILILGDNCEVME